MYNFLTWLARLAARTSREKLDRIAWLLARLIFDILRIRRKVVLTNLKIAFGEALDHAERVKLGRISIHNFCRTFLEFLYASENDPTDDTHIEGMEHLNAALAHGQGVFVLCTHLGNWEAMGAKLGKVVGPTWIPAKKVALASVNRFLTELREKRNFFPIKRQKKGDGLRIMREALARNQVVGIVIDQTRPGEPKLPFFGRPAKTNTSYAAIWRRVGCPPVISAYIKRTAFAEHTLKFFPAVELQPTGSEEGDTIAHTRIFNDIAEKMIRESPEIYFWMHDRWKE